MLSFYLWATQSGWIAPPQVIQSPPSNGIRTKPYIKEETVVPSSIEERFRPC